MSYAHALCFKCCQTCSYSAFQIIPILGEWIILGSTELSSKTPLKKKVFLVLLTRSCGIKPMFKENYRGQTCHLLNHPMRTTFTRQCTPFFYPVFCWIFQLQDFYLGLFAFKSLISPSWIMLLVVLSIILLHLTFYLLRFSYLASLGFLLSSLVLKSFVLFLNWLPLLFFIAFSITESLILLHLLYFIYFLSTFSSSSVYHLLRALLGF